MTGQASRAGRASIAWSAGRQRHPVELGAGLYRAAIAVSIVLAVVIAVLATLDWLLAPTSLITRNVRFEGEFRQVNQAELVRTVRELVRSNFLLLDLDAVRKQIETLPWVYRATVRRAWPLDVYVQFEEQRIVARWAETANGTSLARGPRLDPAGEAWVNHVGEAVSLPVNTRLPGDMPLLEGPPGSAASVLTHYEQVAPVLAEHGLVVKALTLTPRRTWELAVESSDLRGAQPGAAFRLVVDRYEPERKIERFARAYSETLSAQAAGLAQLDLRYANGFTVQWKPQAH